MSVELKMPWGKFKNKKISDLPSSYLLWVAENVKEESTLNKAIVKLCDEEWQYRERYNCHTED